MNNFDAINTESGNEFDSMLHCPWDSLLTDNNDLGGESNETQEGGLSRVFKRFRQHNSSDGGNF
jgi:hypothetical protein